MTVSPELAAVYRQLIKVRDSWRLYKKSKSDDDYSKYKLQLALYQMMHDEWHEKNMRPMKKGQ